MVDCYASSYSTVVDWYQSVDWFQSTRRFEARDDLFCSLPPRVLSPDLLTDGYDHTFNERYGHGWVNGVERCKAVLHKVCLGFRTVLGIVQLWVPMFSA